MAGNELEPRATILGPRLFIFPDFIDPVCFGALICLISDHLTCCFRVKVVMKAVRQSGYILRAFTGSIDAFTFRKTKSPNAMKFG